MDETAYLIKGLILLSVIGFAIWLYRYKVPPSEPPGKTSNRIQFTRLSVGPSPWAWRNRSHHFGGKQYRFRDLEEEGDLSGIIQVVNEQNEVILLLDFYFYARFLEDGRTLLWYEDGEKDNKTIAFLCLHFDKLSVITDPVAAAKEMRKNKATIYGYGSNKIHHFACFLQPGTHRVKSPPDWGIFEETLVLADHSPGGNGYDIMHRALFVFDWIKQEVTVLPQDWFNQGKYDFGYQWVARIARTDSGQLIGEGIRLGTFELDETGRQVKRWLSENPFHMIQ